MSEAEQVAEAIGEQLDAMQRLKPILYVCDMCDARQPHPIRCTECDFSRADERPDDAEFF